MRILLSNVSKIGKWFRKIEGEWEIQIDHNGRQQVLKEKQLKIGGVFHV